jgi:hypothetical protein
MFRNYFKIDEHFQWMMFEDFSTKKTRRISIAILTKWKISYYLHCVAQK